MKVLKRIFFVSILAAITTIVLSYLYNFPIHFWAAAPKSVVVLHEAGSTPDNIVLTPTDDMRTKISITWRTSNTVTDGAVQFAVAGSPAPVAWQEWQATRHSLYSRDLKSNNTVHCYSATLTGLKPGTTYHYRVGCKALNSWSDYRSFTTAPTDSDTFTFVYFGDTQAYPERFGKMLEAVEQRHPETAFYMIGGDLVDQGELRNQWDDLLANTGNIFSYKPIVPAMGNHDFSRHKVGGGTYRAYFTLPVSRPSDLSYSFQRGNTFFIVINARLRELKEQRDWLEEQLKKAMAAGCDFKVVMCHFPAYNPKEGRSNEAAKQYWVPLFDKYGVDLMLSGHDHSYMRSNPLIGGRVVPSSQTGTTYIVATGCEKFYKFRQLDIAAKQFAGVATYQVISTGRDLSGSPILSYMAFAPDGELLDQFKRYKR